MISFFYWIAPIFLLAFLACFRPIRAVLRVALRFLLAGVSLVFCNALGLGLGINLLSICFVALLGIPGLCTLGAIYTLL